MMKRISFILAPLSFALMMLSCAKEQPNIGAAEEPAISLSVHELSMKQGDSYHLTLRHGISDVEWTSSADSIASVNYRGVVSAHRNGNTWIVASRAGKTDTCKVIVGD